MFFLVLPQNLNAQPQYGLPWLVISGLEKRNRIFLASNFI